MKEFLVPQYAPLINKRNPPSALIRIQIPINRVPVKEEESKQEEGSKTEDKRKAGKAELEKLKKQQDEIRREIRRRELVKRNTLKEEEAEAIIEGRNNRKEKRLEDYDVNNLEHYYGDRFIK